MEGSMFLMVFLGVSKTNTYQKLFYENPLIQFKSQLENKEKWKQEVFINLVELFRTAQIPEELAFHFSLIQGKELLDYPPELTEQYYILECKGGVTFSEELDEVDYLEEDMEELLFEKYDLEEEICAVCEKENECETCKTYKRINNIEAKIKELGEKIKSLTDYSTLNEEERIGEYLCDFFINKYNNTKEVFPTFYENPIQILDKDLVLLSYYVEAC